MIVITKVIRWGPEVIGSNLAPNRTEQVFVKSLFSKGLRLKSNFCNSYNIHSIKHRHSNCTLKNDYLNSPLRGSRPKQSFQTHHKSLDLGVCGT